MQGSCEALQQTVTQLRARLSAEEAKQAAQQKKTDSEAELREQITALQHEVKVCIHCL